jgi:hypothetical protein
MARYGLNITSFATTTSVKTAALVHANAAGERGELLEYILTGDGIGAAADVQHRASIQTYDATGAGTPGSSPTPSPTDQFANPARCLVGIEYTAEPTVLAPGPVLFGFNQRGGYGYARSVGCGLPFAHRATGLVGWACCVQSGAAGSVDGHMQWDEP